MSKRQMFREKRRLQNRVINVAWIAGLVALFGILALFIWNTNLAPAVFPTPTSATTLGTPLATSGPLLGEAIPVDPDRSHIPEDSDPGPYNSNPPTSGHHYPTPLTAGFYDTNTYKYPQGHLVHDLEHGYIIFWYNCKQLSDGQCADMKTQIKTVMHAAEDFKVIAYPWDSIDVPVALTSWGFLLRMKTFDPALAATFIQQHRNRSPEPDAP